jgi:mono/diheme cytochrome c family protein
MRTRYAMRLFTGLATGAVALVALIGVTSAQQPGAPTIKKGEFQALVSVDGKDNFAAYCAVCHGLNGKGSGPAVSALKVPVPDLTTMAKRYGKFDELAVQNQISGVARMPPAHGSVDMPIWGPLFRSQGSDQGAVLRVRNLATHIGSLQVK